MPRPERVTAAVKLFKDQVVTVAKRGNEVALIAADADSAAVIFEWVSCLGDDAEGDPIGWKIVATGSDGSVLCESPTGARRRYLF